MSVTLASVSSSTGTAALDELREALDQLTRENTSVLQLVSDYPPGDPADTKMATAIMKHAPISALLPSVVVRPLDTAQLSFRALMLAMSPSSCVGDNVWFYVNVAPIEKRHHRNGEHPFCVALLTNGKLVASPMAGYSLSAFKPWIKRLYVLRCDQKGKQFRSWQAFPEPLGQLLRGEFDVIESCDDALIESIPALPAQFVCDDDSFCNLRTLMCREDLEAQGFVWGDECILYRDGVPVSLVLFGDPQAGSEHNYGARWLSLKPGSNIIDPGDDQPQRTHLDLFRVYGKASRLAVYDINEFSISLWGAFSEAIAVATRARRTSGLLSAANGFAKVLRLRLHEWRSDVGDYERKQPVYSLKKI